MRKVDVHVAIRTSRTVDVAIDIRTSTRFRYR